MEGLVNIIRLIKSAGIEIRYERFDDAGIVAYYDPAITNTIFLNKNIFAVYKPDSDRLDWTAFILAHEFRHWQQFNSGKSLGNTDKDRYVRELDADIYAIDLCAKFGILNVERHAVYLKKQSEFLNIKEVKEYVRREHKQLRKA